MPLNWRNIAAFSCVLMASIAVAIASRSRLAGLITDPNYYVDAHAMPFDVADASARSAFDMFLLRTIANYGLQPQGCEQEDEYYRAETAPGLGAGEFAAVELRISGNIARSIRHELGRRAPDTNIDWHTVSNETVDMGTVQVVRDDAVHLLRSGASPAGPIPPPDSSEWIVDMCWHGRYHFFHRYSPGAISQDREFITFARRVLSTSKSMRGGGDSISDSKAENCPN
jgi:hypothetical protein